MRFRSGARGRGGGALNPRGDGEAGAVKRAVETAVESLRFFFTRCGNHGIVNLQ